MKRNGRHRKRQTRQANAEVPLGVPLSLLRQGKTMAGPRVQKAYFQWLVRNHLLSQESKAQGPTKELTTNLGTMHSFHLDVETFTPRHQHVHHVLGKAALLRSCQLHGDLPTHQHVRMAVRYPPGHGLCIRKNLPSEPQGQSPKDGLKLYMGVEGVDQ